MISPERKRQCSRGKEDILDIISNLGEQSQSKVKSEIAHCQQKLTKRVCMNRYICSNFHFQLLQHM